MKKETLQKRVQIANNIMYYIYIHIDTELSIDELSLEFGIEKFYMQRVFKEIFSRTIYESIKSIRLQKASNLLLTNRYSTISKIAASCGYTSHSSFIKAFKERFGMTPKAWRKGGYIEYSSKILSATPTSLKQSFDAFELIEPEIVKMPTIQSYYIRNNSYDSRQIKQSWQKLYAWLLEHDVQEHKEIALFHDNPAITPLQNCHYVACIAQTNIKSSRLPQFSIAKGVYAKFDVRLQKGEILHFIQWVYHQWLPQSDFETSTKPSYAIYHDNKYLQQRESYFMSFYLPVKF